MTKTQIDKLDPKKYILVKNVHQNNLKNLDIAIPHNKLVIITGVSGSGKSTLAFETLYEEGRRRYVESLSSYVRQFLGKIKKPHVDFIKGLPPAIAIEQKRSTSNSRSTVGTVTEIYDYLKLLFARIGKTYSPVSKKVVRRHTIDDIIDFILSQKNGKKVMILSPIVRDNKRGWKEELETLLQKGFSRILIGKEIVKAEEFLSTLEQTNSKSALKEIDKTLNGDALILIDRITVNSANNKGRIGDSVQTAFYEGKGQCFIDLNDSEQQSKRFSFSNSFELDGIIFEEPTVDLFAFNSPHGACRICGGMGDILGIDEKKVIQNPNISLYDGAVVCWEGEKMSKWKRAFINKSAKYDFPIFKPYSEYSEKEKDLLWEGNKEVSGINSFFDFVESKSYKMHYRIFMSRFKGKTTCRECKGVRLRREANYIKIDGRSLGELVLLPISELYDYFQSIKLDKKQEEIAQRILFEIITRLRCCLM